MYNGAAVTTRDDTEPKPMSFIWQLECLNLVLVRRLHRAKKQQVSESTYHHQYPRHLRYGISSIVFGIGISISTGVGFTSDTLC